MKNGVLVGTYPLKIAILGAIVGFTITVIAFNIVKTKLSKKDIYCEIIIYFYNKKVKAKALLDTGNMLRDPITNFPVIIVEKDILKKVLPESILNNISRNNRR